MVAVGRDVAARQPLSERCAVIPCDAHVGLPDIDDQGGKARARIGEQVLHLTGAQQRLDIHRTGPPNADHVDAMRRRAAVRCLYL